MVATGGQEDWEGLVGAEHCSLGRNHEMQLPSRPPARQEGGGEGLQEGDGLHLCTRIPAGHWLMLPAATGKLLQPQGNAFSTSPGSFSLQVYVPRLISHYSFRESAFPWV